MKWNRDYFENFIFIILLILSLCFTPLGKHLRICRYIYQYTPNTKDDNISYCTGKESGRRNLFCEGSIKRFKEYIY